MPSRRDASLASVAWVVGCGEVAGDAGPSDRAAHMGGVMWLKRDAYPSSGPWTGRPSPELGEARCPIQCTKSAIYGRAAAGA